MTGRKIVTQDAKIDADAAKRDAGDDALSHGPFVEITSVEQLQRLAVAAKRTKDHFDEEIAKRMNRCRACFVRQLRRDGYSWRALARETWIAWGDDACWEPPSNQLAGMALCEAAAELFGEDPHGEPWN